MAALTEAAAGHPCSIEVAGNILALPGAFGLHALRRSGPLGFLRAQVAANESEIINLAVALAAKRQGGSAGPW